jgi:hypothetical protein
VRGAEEITPAVRKLLDSVFDQSVRRPIARGLSASIKPVMNESPALTVSTTSAGYAEIRSAPRQIAYEP